MYKFFLIGLFLLLGCNNLKHYQKVAADPDVTLEKKRILAPWIAMNFPPMIVTKPGKEVVKVDTVYDQKAVDSLSRVVRDLIKDTAGINVDSLINAVKKLCVPRTKYELIVRVDTTTVIDNVQLEAARYDLYQCNKGVIKLQSEKQTLEKKITDGKTDSLNYKLYLLIAGLIIAVETYLLIKPR